MSELGWWVGMNWVVGGAWGGVGWGGVGCGGGWVVMGGCVQPLWLLAPFQLCWLNDQGPKKSDVLVIGLL